MKVSKLRHKWYLWCQRLIVYRKNPFLEETSDHPDLISVNENWRRHVAACVIAVCMQVRIFEVEKDSINTHKKQTQLA